MATAWRASDNPRMPTKANTAEWTIPRRILVIDVGGSHIKFRVGPRGKIAKFVSGPGMTAAAMVKGVAALAPRSSYDAVSIGYPGLVIHGKIAAEPYNLGHGWVHFDFGKAFGAPVRVINDAAMQAIGSYRGGRMLFLGLGTGLGATLILDGMVEPMEIGHLPYKRGRSFEDYVGERGRCKLGTRKWRKTVREVVEQLSRALEVDYVVLGGGNLRRLRSLPRNARPGDNRNAFTGGLRIWQHGGDSLALGPRKQT